VNGSAGENDGRSRAHRLTGPMWASRGCTLAGRTPQQARDEEFVRRVRCEAYRERADRSEAAVRAGRAVAGSLFDPPLTEAEVDAALARLEAGAREAERMTAAVALAASIALAAA
jgi:hypothetical protein